MNFYREFVTEFPFVWDTFQYRRHLELQRFVPACRYGQMCIRDRDEYVRISINEEKALFKLKEIWSYLRWSFPESTIWDRQMKVAGDLETFLYGMRNLLDTYDPEKIPEKRGIPGLHNR